MTTAWTEVSQLTNQHTHMCFPYVYITYSHASHISHVAHVLQSMGE